MDPFAPKAVLVATTSATFLAWHAVRRKSLTKAGALTGFIVGFSLVATGLRGFCLFGFYQLGSIATKYKATIKAQRDATVAHGSQRGAQQVLCVSIIAVALSLCHAYLHGPEQPLEFVLKNDHSGSGTGFGPTHLATAVLAHHAAALGDTLASELGMSNSRQQRPRLVIPPFRAVPVGTNGGVTWGGTVWSCIGGALMGLLTVFMDAISGILPVSAKNYNYTIVCTTILYGAVMGGLGSWIDSVLGATLQSTWYNADAKQVTSHSRCNNKHLQRICGRDVLTNEQVNLLSGCLASILGGWVVGPWMWGCFSYGQ
jgi:uncharacterized membrane protein